MHNWALGRLWPPLEALQNLKNERLQRLCGERDTCTESVDYVVRGNIQEHQETGCVSVCMCMLVCVCPAMCVCVCMRASILMSTCMGVLVYARVLTAKVPNKEGVWKNMMSYFGNGNFSGWCWLRLWEAEVWDLSLKKQGKTRLWWPVMEWRELFVEEAWRDPHGLTCDMLRWELDCHKS